MKVIYHVRCDYKVIAELNLAVQLKDTCCSLLQPLVAHGPVLGVLLTSLSNSFKNELSKHNQSHLFPLLYMF